MMSIEETVCIEGFGYFGFRSNKELESHAVSGKSDKEKKTEF